MLFRSLALWTARVLLAALFVFASSGKLMSQPEAVEAFENIGAPWLRWVIGICELAGGIGILLPQTAALAALCLALVMVGAMVMHVLVLGVSSMAPAVIAFALSAWVAIELRRPGAA